MHIKLNKVNFYAEIFSTVYTVQLPVCYRIHYEKNYMTNSFSKYGKTQLHVYGTHL